jgi:glycosyltransferase involved in cell wall biosynthesis
MSAHPLVSVVVIGRNEGARLSRCLNSVLGAQAKDFEIEMIYVDSASTDDSVARAVAAGARVVEVHPDRPSAALGRNAGWAVARGEYILFLDGDTILQAQFMTHALTAMADPAVVAVWGHRREIAPEQSVYVRLLDLDWIYRPGDTLFCGGDALMRRSALEAVGGFDQSLIAGEEPELCSRLRSAGGVIRHIDVPMTGHDLALVTFSAYWRRAFRAGHAYAEVAQRCRNTPGRLWTRDSRRNLVHGFLLLVAGVLFPAAWFMAPWVALAALYAGLAVIVRSAWRNRWKSADPMTQLLYAAHSHFQQIPIFFGQLAFHVDRLLGRHRSLIEYKRSAA